MCVFQCPCPVCFVCIISMSIQCVSVPCPCACVRSYPWPVRMSCLCQFIRSVSVLCAACMWFMCMCRSLFLTVFLYVSTSVAFSPSLCFLFLARNVEHMEVTTGVRVVITTETFVFSLPPLCLVYFLTFPPLLSCIFLYAENKLSNLSCHV